MKKKGVCVCRNKGVPVFLCILEKGEKIEKGGAFL